MAYTPVTIAEFKARFDRDFGFAVDQTDLKMVRDVDVTRALTQAGVNFNEGLWSAQATFAEAFLLLAAHFLCTNLLASSQGLGGQGTWLLNSKAAGGVSSAFAIPDRIARSPFLALLSKTLYGQQYLTLIAPLLIGNVVGIQRETGP